AGVTHPPCDAVAQPGLDCALIALPIEHPLTLGLGQTVEDREADHLGRLRAVNPASRDLDHFWRDVERLDLELEIGPARTQRPEDRVDLDADAATENRDLDRSVATLVRKQAAHQFESRAIAQEVGAHVHLSIGGPADQRVQPRAIGSNRPELARPGGKAPPDTFVADQERRLEAPAQMPGA